MKILFLLTLLCAPHCLAKVTIAFIEVRLPDGRLLQMEPGGRFSHIAISYRGLWLHAHPYRGVELITTEQLKNLDRSGFVILKSLPNHEEITETELATYLDKPFDSNFSWESEAYYCSKLVAKILKIVPKPMTFSAAGWPEAFKSKAGQLGISPDEIYQEIASESFRRQSIAQKCEGLF